MLRERFDDFLGKYVPGEIYAFSTNTHRTKMTLSLVLAGLYPPSPSDSWSNEVYWSPIPTFYEPENRNFLSAGIETCDR